MFFMLNQSLGWYTWSYLAKIMPHLHDYNMVATNRFLLLSISSYLSIYSVYMISKYMLLVVLNPLGWWPWPIWPRTWPSIQRLVIFIEGRLPGCLMAIRTGIAAVNLWKIQVRLHDINDTRLQLLPCLAYHLILNDASERTVMHNRIFSPNSNVPVEEHSIRFTAHDTNRIHCQT